MDLYFDCAWGISGDMTIAALLDSGASFERLSRELRKLLLAGYALRYTKTEKDGIVMSDFDVLIDPDAYDNRVQRNYYDVRKLIGQSPFCKEVKRRACAVLEIAADSQAKAHKTTKSGVYFHETGAIDSIVDIVGTAICLEDLGAGHIFASPLTEGKGMIRYRAGRLPVPVPATKNTLHDHHIPYDVTDVEQELITPTGAAIAAALFEDFFPKQQLKEKGYGILKSGIGAGKREYGKGGFLQCHALI
ncbi:MAG: LarC family nickel insertion protein [Christensenella sp.]|uniref:LarC family nickel insertion protein n=1 Tax=Christensenella sp. TaxID=1935934 RepID=UPI002B1FB3DD|nr:LarC family nickel insertion protein [Christensenella sp.]MEA5001936.1 LarC family nickel insertion protein [Christensenella sp.]